MRERERERKRERERERTHVKANVSQQRGPGDCETAKKWYEIHEFADKNQRLF